MPTLLNPMTEVPTEPMSAPPINSGYSSDTDHIFDSDDESPIPNPPPNPTTYPAEGEADAIGSDDNDINIDDDALSDFGSLSGDEPTVVDQRHKSDEEYVENEESEPEEEVQSEGMSSGDDKPPSAGGPGAKRSARTGREFAFAEENPDLYGLRRSGRARIAPDRFTAKKGQTSTDDEDEDEDYGSRRRNKGSKKGKLKSRAQISGQKDSNDFVAHMSVDEEEISGSDFEGERSRRRRPAKRAPVAPSGNSSEKDLYMWDDDYPRYSTRQRNQGLDYNENSKDADPEDVFEDAAYDQVEYYQPEEETEVIDGFFDQRTVEIEGEDGKTVEQSQYLVKWLGRSFRELQWCDIDYLETLRGFKKIDKFIKEFNERQSILEDPGLTDEDRERVLMEINDKKDLLDEHRKVDRILANRSVDPDDDNPSGIEYYCKWRGLGYEESTWETAASLVEDQAEIDMFLDRQNSQQVPSRSEQFKPDHRPPYKPFREADFLTGGELREFQLIGVNWMADMWHRNENGILADEMGLGKTVQTVSFISYLFHKMKVFGPFLIVVPLGTISAWQREFARWAPDINVVLYQGSAKGRSIIREHEFYSYSNKKGRPPKKILRFNVLLTTYEMIIQDKTHLNRIKWAYLGVDEAHRLKNEASKLHQALAKEYIIQNRLLITGTPLQNNVQELMALIQFLMPNANIDMNLEIDLDATDNQEQKDKIQYLHNLLTKLMLRRLKKDVETSLPGKTELILRIPMSELQKKYYTAIFTKNFAGLKSSNSKDEVRISLQNVVMELKKASNHPFLFPAARMISNNRNDAIVDILSSSGKMVLLDKLLTRMKAEGRRVLIFSQMVNMLNILADYLNLKGLQYQRLDGTVQSEARKRAMDHFNAPNSSDFAFLLSTRAGGLGLNLETADTVILFDLDWNPQNDLQAIARAHRIGQKRHVNVYRFVTAGSIEEDIIERAKRKMVLEYAIIQQMENNGQSYEKAETEKKISEDLQKPTRDELATILKFGAKKLFEQDAAEGTSGEPSADNKVEKLDLDDILARAEETELAQAQPVAGGSDEFMERWKMMNVEMDQLEWDSLIPSNDREKAEAEQLLKEPEAKAPPARKRLKEVSYNEGGDQDDEEKENGAGGRKRGGKTKAKSKKNAQANVLDKKAISDLANALMTWGDIDRKFDDIVAQAGLGEKLPEAVRTHATEILQACEETVKVTEEAQAGQNLSKADREKAIYADYKGTKDINARKMIERIPLLKALTSEMESHKNQLSFRMFTNDLGFTQKWDSKPPWNTKDDSMLLVGVYRHGFGNWRAIQSDADLGFSKKFHLGGERSSEQKDKLLPKKLHLDRRALFLLKELQIRQENRKEAREKTDGAPKKSRKEASSKAATPIKTTKSSKLLERTKSKASSELKEESSPRSATRRKSRNSTDASFVSNGVKEHRNLSDMYFDDYDEKRYKQLLRPVKEQMLRLRGPPPFEDLEPADRIRKQTEWKLERVKNEFMDVSTLIQDLVDKEKNVKNRDRLQAHMFKFLADNFFWTKADGSTEDWSVLKLLWDTAMAEKEKVHKEKENIKIVERKPGKERDGKRSRASRDSDSEEDRGRPVKRKQSPTYSKKREHAHDEKNGDVAKVGTSKTASGSPTHESPPKRKRDSESKPGKDRDGKRSRYSDSEEDRGRPIKRKQSPTYSKKREQAYGEKNGDVAKVGTSKYASGSPVHGSPQKRRDQTPPTPPNQNESNSRNGILEKYKIPKKTDFAYRNRSRSRSPRDRRDRRRSPYSRYSGNSRR
ncbi:SNF2 family N-terminal domain-containing protein [Phlyctochytrium arcticum]|nr:SNF2 family N-terminal domain-containing protein [Phlyctochytrium arcticum]